MSERDDMQSPGAPDGDLPEEGPAPPAPAPGFEAALEGAFAASDARLASVRERVLARLAETAPRGDRRAERKRTAPLPFLGRRRSLLFLVCVSGAVLLLTVYATYLHVIRTHRHTLTLAARLEVRNVAMVVRELRARSSAAPSCQPALAVALQRVGLEVDPFGAPFLCDGGRIWSPGPNGRDDGGAGDDVVARVE